MTTMFRCIPLFRGCNRQVEYIDKRHCSLATVPDDVLRYPRTLEELLLDCNHIRDLPKGLFRLVKLRKLSLSDNEIGRLPPDIASLINLVELDVSKNDIPDIPENIKFLKSLQNADISSNPLTKLPAGFVQLRNLTVLCLNDVSLSQLPSDFGNLQNLQSLELRENLLRGLPPSFAMLSNLERLDLGSNEISELPQIIGQLSSLQELWLDCNELYTMPLEIETLKKLTCLDISENRLEYLPEEIGGLEALTDLHLSQNCLESLPEGIGKLYKLTIFKVDQNRLLALTPQIGNCECLQELILTENLLSEIPNSIGRLVNLTNLNVDRNRLSELPSQIGNLVRLGVLSLRENRLNFLPEETGKLKELHVLDVSGNRLQYLPITITALNLKALWLAENQSQPMLKFQTDINERTGAKVLTCFLLPQQEYHPESMENLLRDSIEQDSRLSWDQKGDRTSSVKFVEETDEDKEDKETQFVRHDTPHPRELKARHNKLLVSKSKNIDGHVVAHDEKDNEVLDSFRPQRSSITSVTSSSSETSATQFKDAVQSLADIPDSDDPQEANLTEEETPVVSCMSEAPLYRAQTREDLLDEVSVGEHSDNDSEKHVGFNANTEDPAERPNKLHRRDTPHHLKNKRINLVDSQKDQEKVLAILAQEAKKEYGDDSSSQQSMPSSQVSVVSESDKTDTPTCAETLITDSPEEQIEIVIQKNTSGLGLSIAGGVGSTPYVGNDEGIFVSKVIANGPAEKAGLRVGDKILMVKGKSLLGVTHYDAVDNLKTAGNELVMRIKRDSSVTDSLKIQLELETVTAVQSPQQPTPPIEAIIEHSPLPLQNAIQKEVKSESLPNSLPPLTTTTITKDVHVNDSVAIVTKVIENASPKLLNSVKPEIPKKPENLSSIDRMSPGAKRTDNEPVYKSKKPENLVITVPKEEKEENHVSENIEMVKAPPVEYDIKYEILHTTLIREQNGLGISIVGNPQGGEIADGSEGIYITKISENGAAFKDGKLQVGDKVLTINGIDMEGARQDQAVSLLSGLDRFVRLVVQRQKLVPKDPNAPDRNITSALLGQKSPKLIGLPRPYTQRIYSSGSYMANRPSYMGSYRRPEISPASTDTSKTFSLYTKLPGLRNDPADIPSVNNNLSKPLSLPNCNNVQELKSVVVVVQNAINHDNKKPSAYAEMNCVNHVNHGKNVEEISLIKAGGPLGLSIIGGVDHTCHPFGVDEPGIFISKIVTEGAASKTKKLKIGDRLLKVNGAEIHNSTHHDAVMALLAPTYEMTLTVRHDPLPVGWQEIIITKHPTEKLGMGVQGGVKGMPGNPENEGDEGIFIAWVHSDGAVGADGRILPGMRIVEVNETSLLGATYQEAITALRTACDRVRLVVCNGYNVPSLDAVNPEVAIKSAVSSSSIDREDELTHVFREEQEVIEETKQWEQEELEKMEKLRIEKNTEELQQKVALNISDAKVAGDDFLILDEVEPCNVAFSTPMKSCVAPTGEFNDSTFTSDLCMFEISTTTDESVLDPIAKSKLPGAKPLPSKPVKNKEQDAADPEQLTFSEKKRKFELVGKPIDIDEGTVDATKHFTYFSQQELERMREEEEKKLLTMTEEEIKEYHSLIIEDDVVTCDDIVDSHNSLSRSSSSKSPPANISKIPVRTVKAESRVNTQLQIDSSDTANESLSTSQQRALQAAKRSAWRQARLKSLEADAYKAQMVISKACEISKSKSSVSSDNSGCGLTEQDESSNLENSNEAIQTQHVCAQDEKVSVDAENNFEPSENGTCYDEQEDADVSQQEADIQRSKMSSKKRRRRPRK